MAERSSLTTPNVTFTEHPHNLVMPQELQHTVLITFSVIVLLLFLWAIYMSYRRRSILPVLFVIAAGFCVLLEPITDVLGNIIHPQLGQINAYQFEGYPIPWHVIPAYVIYFSVINLVLFKRYLAQDLTPRVWWKTAFWTVLAVIAFEQMPIYQGLWVYFGNQGLSIGFMPLAMITANTAALVVSSLVVYRLMPLLKGWRQLLVLPLLPCTVVAVHTGASIPNYTVLSQDTEHLSAWVLQAGTAGTVGFSLMLIWLGITICYNRIPEAEHRLGSP